MTDGNQLQKRDAGKPRMSLLPFFALVPIVRVLEFGIFKYGKKGGWQEVDDAVSRYTDALVRHAGDLADKGLDHLDAESGLPTVAHLACDAVFLCGFRFLQAGDPGRPWLKSAARFKLGDRVKFTWLGKPLTGTVDGVFEAEDSFHVHADDPEEGEFQLDGKEMELAE